MPLRLFIDANVLFRAADSATGGARELLTYALAENVTLYASKRVFEEAKENLSKKGRAQALAPLEQIRALGVFELIENTGEELAAAAHTVTDPDDVHIVAAAKKAQVDALLSFDVKHLHRKSVEDYIGVRVVKPEVIMQEIRAAEKQS